MIQSQGCEIETSRKLSRKGRGHCGNVCLLTRLGRMSIVHSFGQCRYRISEDADKTTGHGSGTSYYTVSHVNPHLLRPVVAFIF